MADSPYITTFRRSQSTSSISGYTLSFPFTDMCMQLVGTLTPHKSQAQSLLASEGTAATRTWQHTITRQAQQRLLFMPLVAMA